MWRCGAGEVRIEVGDLTPEVLLLQTLHMPTHRRPQQGRVVRRARASASARARAIHAVRPSHPCRSLVSLPATDVSMALCFGHAIPIDEPAFLGGDTFPANGAGDGLRLPEEHPRPPFGTVYPLDSCWLTQAGPPQQQSNLAISRGCWVSE